MGAVDEASSQLPAPGGHSQGCWAAFAGCGQGFAPSALVQMKDLTRTGPGRVQQPMTPCTSLLHGRARAAWAGS